MKDAIWFSLWYNRPNCLVRRIEPSFLIFLSHDQCYTTGSVWVCLLLFCFFVFFCGGGGGLGGLLFWVFSFSFSFFFFFFFFFLSKGIDRKISALGIENVLVCAVFVFEGNSSKKVFVMQMNNCSQLPLRRVGPIL